MYISIDDCVELSSFCEWFTDGAISYGYEQSTFSIGSMPTVGTMQLCQDSQVQHVAQTQPPIQASSDQ